MELSPKQIMYLDTKQISIGCKKVEVTPCILFDYHGLNNKKKKFTNTWEINDLLLNKSGSRQKLRVKLNFLKNLMQMKIEQIQTYRTRKVFLRSKFIA